MLIFLLFYLSKSCSGRLFLTNNLHYFYIPSLQLFKVIVEHWLHHRYSVSLQILTTSICTEKKPNEPECVRL